MIASEVARVRSALLLKGTASRPRCATASASSKSRLPTSHRSGSRVQCASSGRPRFSHTPTSPCDAVATCSARRSVTASVEGGGYLSVFVYVSVKEGCEDAFIAASIDNASNSVQEAGVSRFDVLQSVEEPTQFVLVEVYKSDDAPAQHKETAHYLRWRDTVAEMMAEPRSAVKYYGSFPTREHWDVPAALASGQEEAGSDALLAVHVLVSVTGGGEDAGEFEVASVANATASVQEPGIARFDALQKVTQREDGVTEWMLNEVYLAPEAPAAHKETSHYAAWRDTVAPLMHEPRSAKKYRNIFPRSASGWMSCA